MQRSEIVIDDGKISFVVYHDMPMRQGEIPSIHSAAMNWAYSTNDYTDENFCDYISRMYRGYNALPERMYVPQPIKDTGKKPSIFEREVYETDGAGNKLIYRVYKNGNVIIFLKLIKEKRERKIGVIDSANKILYVMRARGKHLHLTTTSYGFNYNTLNSEVIKNNFPFDRVIVTDEYGSYHIMKEEIFAHGKFLYFKFAGFERQLFVPLSVIEKCKAHENQT